MRLIDANNLLEEMGAGCIPILEKGISQVTGDESTIKDYIDQAPTVDAEPVRHGQWVPVDGEAPCDEWDCTACGRRMTFMVDMGEDDMAENYWRCPKCGAKMDGGTK